MAMDQDHILKARQQLQRRLAQQQSHYQTLHAQATRDFEAILRMIVDEFHPDRVYQWGSLLRPDRFRDYSDIDVAVEGITGAHAYFTMIGKAQAMTDFPVDIVQLEKIEPEFAESIRRDGKLVYERKR
jgi:predicted nucleotidyltransferase